MQIDIYKPEGLTYTSEGQRPGRKITSCFERSPEGVMYLNPIHNVHRIQPHILLKIFDIHPEMFLSSDDFPDFL